MRYIKIAVALLAVFMLASCQKVDIGKEYGIGNIDEQTKPQGEESGGTTIIFEGGNANIDGEGAAIYEGTLSITKAGCYTLSGDLVGSVVVEVRKSEKVELVLNGVSVSNENGSAIYVKSADKVTITLADETENSFSDGETYALSEGAEPNACIYSADDMTIRGNGSLSVYAKCRNGIQTKNDLRIKSGDITVTAPNNALKGKDSVEISGGKITVTGADDGIKSDNETEEGRGVVTITGGNISISCQDDGIQAYRSVEISGDARVYIDANDKKINCDGDVSVEDGCITE